MTSFLLYIARGGLYLGLFYAFYLLVMRRTTFFRLNRILLLAGSYLCLVLPLIRLRTVTAATAAAELTMVGVGGEPGGPDFQAFPWAEVLLALYAAGVVCTMTLFAVSAWKTVRWIRSAEARKCDGCRLVVLEQDTPSFSWGRWVVISRKDLEENPAIFTHERMHVQCRHSLDLLLFLPFQLLFWWNPLIWITREELRLVHEYEADEGVIQNGIDASQYQLLLVRKAVGEQRFSLASGFQHAKLKNRIVMMCKPHSSGWIRWSYLALIPVLAAFMFACNPTKKAEENIPSPVPESESQTVVDTKSSAPEQESVLFQEVDQKPSFNGSDANSFALWVNSNLKYPQEAIDAQIEGSVTLQFTVGSDGVVKDVKVLRGVNEALDAEAVRVLSSSPKWEPGRQNGKAVPVTFTFPVIYKLK